MNIVPFLLVFFAKGTNKVKNSYFVEILKASRDYYATILKNLNKVKVLFVYF